MYKHNTIHIYTEHITLDVHAYTYTNKYDMGTFIHTLNKYTYAQIFMYTMIHIQTIPIQTMWTFKYLTHIHSTHVHTHNVDIFIYTLNTHVFTYTDTWTHIYTQSDLHTYTEHTLIHGYTCTYWYTYITH